MSKTKKISVSWNLNDVNKMASIMNKKLLPGEAGDVLDRIAEDDNLDNESIIYAIESVVRERR